MYGKLFSDLSIAWLKAHSYNVKFWLVLLVMALPICFLINLRILSATFINPHFVGLTQQSPIVQAYFQQEQAISALDELIAREIQNKAGKVVHSYERTLSVPATMDGKSLTTQVSFFSGGYELLGITPILGEITPLDFPMAGSELTIALSYHFWQSHFAGSQEVLGRTLQLNDQSVKVVAVLPSSFSGWRKGAPVSMVVPYLHLAQILPSENTITPDTFSYFIGDVLALEGNLSSLNQHLKDEMFMFDGNVFGLSHAIGIGPAHYLALSQRIDNFQVLFYSLAVFCFIAFMTFFAGEAASKQQEALIRRLCGANQGQLFAQQGLDALFIALSLLFVMVAVLPLCQGLLGLLIVHVDVEFQYDVLELFNLGMAFFSVITLFLIVMQQLQSRMITASIGRGDTATFSQKLQSYVLLALLISLTSIALYMCAQLSERQLALHQTKLGFETEQRFVATFTPPEHTQRQFEANNTTQLLIQQLEMHDLIEQVALTDVAPLTNRSSFSSWYSNTGRPIGTGKQSQAASVRISPNYFSVIGGSYVLGQGLSWQQPTNIVVNNTLWQRYFSGSNLAQASLVRMSTTGQKIEYQIVGVVADLYDQGPDEQVAPTVYELMMVVIGLETLVVHTSAESKFLTEVISQEASRVSPNFKYVNVESLAQLVLNDQKPRNALLLTSLLSALLMLGASIIFTLSALRQLSDKSAREFALKYALGSKKLSLLLGQFVWFLSCFIPLFTMLLLGFMHLNKVLNPEALAGLGSNNTVLAIIVSGLLVFVLASKALFLKQKLKNTWFYLT